MKILITGGCGFLGSNLAIYLKSQGHEITCFDNLVRRGSELILSRILEHECTFFHGDIRNAEDFEKLGSDYELMIECSAEPSVLAGSNGNEAIGLINNNLLGLINCLEFCRKHKVGLIFMSTSRVYPYDRLNGHQFEELETRFEISNNNHEVSVQGVTLNYNLEGVRSLYGATKLAAEYLIKEYSHNYGVPSVVNRFGVIAGPWQLGKVDQGVFTFWLANHYFKKKLSYIGYGGKGKQVRDLIHVQDACEIIGLQVNQIERFQGDIFNVGGGDFSSLSLLETTKICEDLTGNKLEISSIMQDRHADLIWFKADSSKIIDTFNWKPKYTASDILTDTYNWLNENEATFTKIFNS
jgi:CDP-paratose 2-epimerase